MNLQVGVKVIIQNGQGRILLLKRAAQYSVGPSAEEAWDIPGGRITPEEGLESALTREVEEEIGVALRGAPKLLSAQDIFVTSKDMHVVRLTYIHCQDMSNIKLSEEHDEFRWVSIEEAKTIGVEPFLKAAIESLS